MGAPVTPPPFRPRAPWWGGDLQTLRNTIMWRDTPLPSKSERLFFPLRDDSGDRLTGMLERPAKPVKSPLVVLIHGLTGSEDSAYLRASAAFHLARGRRVLRLNLRGSGPSRAICGGHYHAGCARDVRDALAGLHESLTSEGLFVTGFSLGGNVLINLLARYGEELPIRGAVSVSAPIEPEQTARRLMAGRNFFYHRWLLKKMKSEASAPGAHLSDRERRAIAAARTILEFDDQFVARRFGFNNAPNYYYRTAGARVIRDIRVPAWLLHARDDPWIPTAPYEALRERTPPGVRIIVAPGGGHVGFHGAGHAEPWHDHCADVLLRSL